MKSLKKTLALLVVFSMVLSTFVTAFADVTDVAGLDCEEEVTRLVALDVVKGYEDGTYGPEKTITRAEMAVILCKMVGISSVTVDENKNVPSKFSDVAAGEWYTGYINVAAGKGLLSGFPDGTFRPNEQLTMNQVLTLCVNALGRGEYVSTMGTWPANYIAEATKLGLLDGVKTSDANRGNVAIICWNTLVAPYVWDVTTTEYEGTINLGNSTRSLLSIYFRDFTCDDTTKLIENGLLKEAEYVQVVAVPSTNGTTLGDAQFEIAKTDDTDAADYKDLINAIKDTKKPRATDDEEWTSVNGNGNIVAYAPNAEKIDSLFGKIVTVIFGKDNEVVSIRVIDETAESDGTVAYEDKKLKIDGTTYKFADEAEVYVNTVAMTSDTVNADKAMGLIATALKIDFAKKYNKAIKTSIVKDTKGKISRLDMFVSGTYPEFNTVEAVVTKVKNDVVTTKVLKADGTVVSDFEIDFGNNGFYEEEDDRPRTIKDGEVISVEDIQAGDVLTCYMKDSDINDEKIKTINVSRSTVSGEVTRASKTDLKATLDGTAYYASMGETAAKFFLTDDKLTDADAKDDASKYISEKVTLYRNMYGEYVLMVAEDEAEDWKFGVVTRILDEDEDNEDDDVFYKKARILLADGTTSRAYTFKYDAEEDKAADWDKVDALENCFIVFNADTNGYIELNEYERITGDATIADGDYIVKVIAKGTVTDDDRERIDGKIFADSTVIFNLRKKDGKYDPTTSKDWDCLINNDKTLHQDTLLVYEDDAKTLSYVLIEEDDYGTSDAEYAIVATDDYKEKDGSTTKKYVDLLLANKTEAEKIEAKELSTPYATDMEEMFVEYTLSGSKLNTVAKLIDLPEFKKLKASEEVGAIVAESAETLLAVTAEKFVKVEAAGTGIKQVVANEVEHVATADEIYVDDTNIEALNVVEGDYVKYNAPITAHYEACKVTDPDAEQVVKDLGKDEIAISEVKEFNADQKTAGKAVPEVTISLGDTVKKQSWDEHYEVVNVPGAGDITVVADHANTEVPFATVVANVADTYDTWDSTRETIVVGDKVFLDGGKYAIRHANDESTASGFLTVKADPAATEISITEVMKHVNEGITKADVIDRKVSKNLSTGLYEIDDTNGKTVVEAGAGYIYANETGLTVSVDDKVKDLGDGKYRKPFVAIGASALELTIIEDLPTTQVYTSDTTVAPYNQSPKVDSGKGLRKIAKADEHYNTSTDLDAETVVKGKVLGQIYLAEVITTYAEATAGDFVKYVAEKPEEWVVCQSSDTGAKKVVGHTEANVAGTDEILLKDANVAGGSFKVGDYIKENTLGFTPIKANYKVIDTQKSLIEYEDDEDDVKGSFGELTLDEDVVVYDARNGEIKATTFSALKEEVKEDGYVYVVAYKNSDCEKGSDANILVIVD